MKSLFYGTSGPEAAPVVVVGEAWGVEEAQVQHPFVGQSGQELHRLLSEAGLSRNDVLFTNVVAARPDGNEMWRFFEPKATSKKSKMGGLLPSDLVESELTRLYGQLGAHPRKLVIGAGNYPLWALSNNTKASVLRESNRRRIPEELQTFAPSGIGSWRGSMIYCTPHATSPHDLSKIPFLPIYHPAAILRQWALRAPTSHDLRLRVPMALRGDWRHQPALTLISCPTFEQCFGALQRWLYYLDHGPVELASDIETARQMITCTGFCDGPNYAIAIPFIRKTEEGGFASWWSITEEAHLIGMLRRVFSHPNLRLIGQNFLYDTQYIERYFAVQPRLWWDTMLAQNVLFPGTPKDLGYLSSLYCRYHWFWKEDAKEWDTKGTVEDLLLYNCWDNLRTFEIAQKQREAIASAGLEPQMQFKMRVNDLCLRMMRRGVRIDIDRRSRLLPELMSYSERLCRDLYHIVPQERVNPNAKTPWFNSPQQTAFLFYNQFAFDPVLHPKTGQPTVGKVAYPILRRKYPEFSGLFNRLDELGSLENTIQVMNTALDVDGRMRCSYNPGGTETHRLSSSQNVFGGGTNLQNLTTGDEDE